VVKIVWDSFSGADGRDSDRLIEIPRRRAAKEQQSTEAPKNRDPTSIQTARLGWLPLPRPPD